MKKFTDFLKTSLIGGLFVLLPLILFYLLLAEMLEFVVALATPIADLFPKGTFDRINTPVLIALLLIVGASFIFGLALRSMTLKRLGLWIEQAVLSRLHTGDSLCNRGSRGRADDRTGALGAGILRWFGKDREQRPDRNAGGQFGRHFQGPEPLGRGGPGAAGQRRNNYPLKTVSPQLCRDRNKITFCSRGK